MSDNPNAASDQVAKSGFFTGLHPGMGIASKVLIVVFILFTILMGKNAEGNSVAGEIFKSIRSTIESTLNWYYITAVAIMMFVCFFLMFSKWGSIRLGDDDSRPEFSNFSWFAMLFSAGVGIGILFFGVAEPVFYFENSGGWGYPNNPHADNGGVAEMNMQRAVYAMRVTFFHWGFHGWSVYVMIGLCLAYFGFRKKLPLTLRSALYPVIGERIYGPIGHAVDLLAVFGTVFGVATSLGLGVSQMATGLGVVTGMEFFATAGPENVWPLILLIAIISGIATVSAVSGVGNGIRIISEWNIWLSVVLLAGFIILGPTKWLLSFFVTSYGDYLWNFIPMGFWTAGTEGGAKWQGDWTLFYWGWWISWAPFVGMFIARISRGRTIREFMVGVMFVPTAIAFFWICMFGGSAIWMELQSLGETGKLIEGGIAQTVMAWNLPSALFGTIERLSDISFLTTAMSALATFLLATWFITSSDSGTLVITTMLSMGDDDPPKKFRIIWGMGEGLVAAVLLLANGLSALQTASIAAALPISVIMLFMTYGLVKSLVEDPSAAPINEAQFAPDGTRIAQDLRA